MTLKTLISTAFFAIALSACNNKEQGISAVNTSPPGLNQSQEKKKPPPKKVVKVEEIDFSKLPGVIRPAAFGYYFGLTREQIEGAGIEIETKDQDNAITSATTISAPIPWADAETYALVFHEGKLLKITAFGKDITNDSTGSDGKAKFKELRESLTEKYGKPSKSLHSVGNRLWDKPDEFYQCLAYDGCGAWLDLWSSNDRTIGVSLKGGGRRGEGFITISYEAQPEWDTAVDAINANKKLKTKKGL